jgi:hypothetical protein
MKIGEFEGGLAVSELENEINALLVDKNNQHFLYINVSGENLSVNELKKVLKQIKIER